jgi:hypothetical protein
MIAINVPFGKVALVLGTIVTLVLSSILFLRAIACVVRLCTIHPSFLRILINSKPLRAGILWYFKYAGLPYGLDKYVLSHRYLYPKARIS